MVIERTWPQGQKKPQSDAEILILCSLEPRQNVVVRCDTDKYQWKRRNDFDELIAAAAAEAVIIERRQDEFRFFNGSTLRFVYTGGGDRWEDRLRGLSNLTII